MQMYNKQAQSETRTERMEMCEFIILESATFHSPNAAFLLYITCVMRCIIHSVCTGSFAFQIGSLHSLISLLGPKSILICCAMLLIIIWKSGLISLGLFLSLSRKFFRQTEYFQSMKFASYPRLYQLTVGPAEPLLSFWWQLSHTSQHCVCGNRSMLFYIITSILAVQPKAVSVLLMIQLYMNTV